MPRFEINDFDPPPATREVVSDLLGYDPYAADVMGLSFKKLFKSVSKGLGKSLSSVAKLVGPAVATVIPGSGPFVAAGMNILKEAKAGNPKAKAKINKIKVAAQAGNPTAIKSLDALQAAQAVEIKVKTDAGIPVCPVCKK